jgi:hypothetical protein
MGETNIRLRKVIALKAKGEKSLLMKPPFFEKTLLDGEYAHQVGNERMCSKIRHV